jgi:hypothetical protein
MKKVSIIMVGYPLPGRLCALDEARGAGGGGVASGWRGACVGLVLEGSGGAGCVTPRRSVPAAGAGVTR